MFWNILLAIIITCCIMGCAVIVMSIIIGVAIAISETGVFSGIGRRVEKAVINIASFSYSLVSKFIKH